MSQVTMQEVADEALRYQVESYSDAWGIVDTHSNSAIAISYVYPRAISLADRLNLEVKVIQEFTELLKWAKEVPVTSGESHEKVIASRVMFSRCADVLKQMQEVLR